MIRLPHAARLGLAGTALFAAFTFIASIAFLYPTGLWAAYRGPSWPVAWWLYLFERGDNPIVQKWLIVSGIPAALLPLLLVAGIVYRLRRRPILRARRDGRVQPAERGISDNHGHSDWRSLEQTKLRFPGPHPLWGGLVVGEAYRVDLDRSIAGIPFNPDDKTTWGRLGGRAPLLIDPCTHGGHSATFAGTGSGKSATAVTQIDLMQKSPPRNLVPLTH